MQLAIGRELRAESFAVVMKELNVILVQDPVESYDGWKPNISLQMLPHHRKEMEH